ncbi:hypothetical protein P409_00940 [Inquilinus limosus MP06]|uniref:Uncharacterized protein n=2 Tax=Inquilinus limosus TaxID=171674 RepID=A0A0A0DDE7_9PROT|nr:hypothetical protein P409_00940 [Inquilinus limosus MP06]
MMQMEIRPTISVWDGDRWHRVDTGAKLLDLLRVLAQELPQPGFVMLHDRAGIDPATIAHRRFQELVQLVERERDAGAEQLSRAAATSAVDLISGYRRVFVGVLP